MALKANVIIETAMRNKRTIVKRSFCSVPFKLADITENKQQIDLRLMLMSSSPGVLDGDDYEFEIDLAEGSSLQLETQSYQRLFQMQHGAIQHTTIRLRQGSSFTYLPHPVVPHKLSCFTAKNKIYLTDGCTLLWSELISCGRKLNDEVFQFTAYHSTTEIFIRERLVVKENLLLQPSAVNLSGVGQMEGFTHQATVLFLHSDTNITLLADTVYDFLITRNEICFGLSALPVNGLVIRLLGHKAELLFVVVRQLSTIINAVQKAPTLKAQAYV